jgi:hypothetical protein
MKITKCRSCYSKKLFQVFSLGKQNLTGIFPISKKHKISSGNLDLVLCKNCTLLQLKHSFDINEMYGENYGYMSSLNASMIEHLKNKAKSLIKISKIKKKDIVVDIGSNDGSFLSFFSKKNVLIGVDPTIKKFKKFYREDILKVSDFFSFQKIKKIIGKRKVKLITSISMFYDLEDPVNFAKDIEKTLADDGLWHLEQSYLPTMLKNNSYDTICHEHLEYYSLTSIEYILNKANLRIIDMSLNSINGGSFAITVCKKKSNIKSNFEILKWVRDEEKKLNLRNIKTYLNFYDKINIQSNSLKNLLINLKKNKKKVVGYGASTKGNVILQYAKITEKLLPFILDVNKFKFGRYTPGSKIKIINEKQLSIIKPDYLLVLPWHFKDFILKKEKNFLKNNKIIFPLPEVEIY